MDKIHKLNHNFFLLKKRLREEDLKKLSKYSYLSIFNFLTNFDKKKKIINNNNNNSNIKKENNNNKESNSNINNTKNNNNNNNNSPIITPIIIEKTSDNKISIGKSFKEKKPPTKLTENEKQKMEKKLTNILLAINKSEKHKPLFNNKKEKNDNNIIIKNDNKLNKSIENSPIIEEESFSKSPIIHEEEINEETNNNNNNLNNNNLNNNNNNNIIENIKNIIINNFKNKNNNNNNNNLLLQSTGDSSISKISNIQNHTNKKQTKIDNNNLEIKKKDFDLILISMIIHIISQIKKNFDTKDKNSPTTKKFNEIFHLLNDEKIKEFQNEKRIKLICENSLRSLALIFKILENEINYENYISQINEILDSLNEFKKKAKKIIEDFKLYKITINYIYALNNVKLFNYEKLKNILKEGKTENLIKFVNIYKKYLKNTKKLKNITNNFYYKINDDENSLKKDIEFLITYFEMQPTSILYQKSFSVCKTLIKFILKQNKKLLKFL